MVSSLETTTGRRRGRPPTPHLERRIANDTLAAVRELGPVTGETLRELVTGGSAQVDQAVRVLIVSGRLVRTRLGYVLAEQAKAPKPEDYCATCARWWEGLVLREVMAADPVDGSPLRLRCCPACALRREVRR